MEYSKKEIASIFKIELKDLEKFIKKNSIKNDNERKNGGYYGVTYLYNLQKFIDNELFISIIPSNIDLEMIIDKFITKMVNPVKGYKKLIKDELYNRNTEEQRLLKKEEENKRKEILNSITENYVPILNEEIFGKNEEYQDTQYILHIGDTNSGKTYNAINLLKETGGVYLSPLRLLAWEVYDTLNKDKNICSLITGEEIIKHKGSIIDSCTVEMLDIHTEYNTIVIDECFMLNDKDRGKSWLRAILNGKCKYMHLIANPETKDILIEILQSINRTNIEVKQYNKLVPLEVVNKQFNERKVPKKSLLIVFSRISVLRKKVYYEKLGYKVSILYGNLPPDVKKKEIEKFKNNKTDICITTDVVGMGLNLPCEYVFFLETEKYDGVSMRGLNNTEIKQISGRAGRYGLYNTGYVGSVKTRFINKIKHSLNTYKKVKNTYIGFDYKVVKDIEYKTMKERIKLWLDSDFIPRNLKHIVLKEDTSKYLNLLNKDITIIEETNKDLAWSLLYLPVKKNNLEYFRNICSLIKNDYKIEAPNLRNFKIKNVNDLEVAESILSKIDIFNYISNNDIFSDYIKDDIDYKSIQEYKYKLITKINTFLLNKQLTSMKKCENCGINVGIEWEHRLCDNCYYENMYRFYN